ncbi:hypothetical protein EDI_047410 [Entamoeba dispar SAW760]|uniref:Uncharacterized protein n=1 Tax=Entamoeba dispar (strain ATCC PRA-260 / SAW760) TaxID=370354 RepID=B0EGE7_ENTDS|nr:uncharacterized protein EDI_047410 [Entamoeba dispar SAW760]EDR26401.1 hypothetical protein EDI_047410 [Entamoeba dispar SAW760]|eukprot:EDR26401.1 hypothetical protein EDI_047410 [Entamoeba dispar SAW760]
MLEESILLLKTLNTESIGEVLKLCKTEYLTYRTFLQQQLIKMKEAYLKKDIQINSLINELQQKTQKFTSILQRCNSSIMTEEVGLFPDDVAKLRDQILVDLESVD